MKPAPGTDVPVIQRVWATPGSEVRRSLVVEEASGADNVLGGAAAHENVAMVGIATRGLLDLDFRPRPHKALC